MLSESTSSSISSFELREGADAGAGSELAILDMLIEPIIENEKE